jgi:hypothetical protein
MSPRGIRNNNPGNIEWGDPWQGLVADRTDTRFAQFKTPAFGIRALARVLITYQDKHGVSTIRAAISRWAPPTENNTEAYISMVSSGSKIGADTVVDFQDYAQLKPIVECIIRHENGIGPLQTLSTWYTEAQIDEGLRLAGVRPDEDLRAVVPRTAETTGATIAGATGLGTLIEVAPTVASAIKGSEEHLTSGQWTRVVVGCVMILVAVLVAYGQVRKHQQGVL